MNVDQWFANLSDGEYALVTALCAFVPAVASVTILLWQTYVYEPRKWRELHERLGWDAPRRAGQ